MTEFEAATIAYQNASLTLATWQTVVLAGEAVMKFGTK